MNIILWRDLRVNAWISWLYGFSLVFWKNTRNRSVLGADYDKFFRQKASLEFDPRTTLSWEKQQLGKGSVLGFCIPPKLSPNKSVKKSLYPGINAWIQAWKFAKNISCWEEQVRDNRWKTWLSCGFVSIITQKNMALPNRQGYRHWWLEISKLRDSPRDRPT